jgi:preprotein translocase subunit YajC
VKGTPAASYDVPDDLSSLPPARGDDTPEKK